MDEHFIDGDGARISIARGTSTRPPAQSSRNKWCTCPLWLVTPSTCSFITRRTFKWRSLSHRKNYKLNINIGTVVMNLSLAPK